jgi:hypothetical protein
MCGRRARPRRTYLLHEIPGKVDVGNCRGRLPRAHNADAATQQHVNHAGPGRRAPGDDKVGLAALAKRKHGIWRRLVPHFDGARKLGDARVGLSAKAAHGTALGRALECADERQFARAATDHAHRRHIRSAQDC